MKIMMKIWIVANIWLVLLSVTAMAQGAPRAEVFGGYQFVYADGGPREDGPSESFLLNG
jgi:hypothetical protein